MEVALVVFVGLALLLAGYAVGRTQQSGPALTGKTVVIHTRQPDDRTLRGTVHAMHADRISLVGASAVLPGGREQALGGVQHVPIAGISFMQEVVPSEG